MNALARLGDPEALQAAEKLLQDPDENVRARQLPVVVDLFRREGRDPVEVVERGLVDSQAEVRETALESATELLDDRLLPTVATLLGDRADRVRYLARQFIQTLGCQDRKHLELVLAFLLDPNQDLNERIGAIQALMYPHRVEFVADILLRTLQDPEVAIRLWAGKALAFYEDRAATAHRLLSLLDTTIPEGVEISLLWALARLGVPEVRTLLVHALVSGDPVRQEPAAFGLGLAGNPEDLAALWERLERPRAD